MNFRILVAGRGEDCGHLPFHLDQRSSAGKQVTRTYKHQALEDSKPLGFSGERLQAGQA
jgi:hypothetical protein